MTEAGVSRCHSTTSLNPPKNSPLALFPFQLSWGNSRSCGADLAKNKLIKISWDQLNSVIENKALMKMTGENARRWQEGMVGGGTKMPRQQRGPGSLYAAEETKCSALQIQYFSEKTL